MTRSDFFMACVQLVLTKSPMDFERALGIYGEASRVPEEALTGEHLETAALAFYKWKAAKAKKPEWLEAWEEGRRNRKVVRVNPEGGGLWWLNAEKHFEQMTTELPFPEELTPMVVGRTRQMVVSVQAARLFEEWVKSVPGHEELPFLFEDVPEGM